MTADTHALHPTITSPLFDCFARFYDDDYRDYDEDLDTLAALALDCGDPVLELGCGTGRALLPVARNRQSVTGIDTSPALLEIARRKIAAAGLNNHVELVQADMRTLSLARTDYAFAYCTSNTLMHLTAPDDQLLGSPSDLRPPASGWTAPDRSLQPGRSTTAPRKRSARACRSVGRPGERRPGTQMEHALDRLGPPRFRRRYLSMKRSSPTGRSDAQPVPFRCAFYGATKQS